MKNSPAPCPPRSGLRPIREGPIVILGAGPTGLGAATLLDRVGFDDWKLFERDEAVGGLTRSLRDAEGFTWDLGGHITFSHYGFYTALLDGLLGPSGWIEHQRESWIRMSSCWVPYPFQNNLHRLPAEERARCLEGLVRASQSRTACHPRTFEEFLVTMFGDGISDLFMRPYNFKVWAYPPSMLDASWVGERVAVPDLARIVRNVATDTDDVSWGPNATFRFPRSGGTGAITQAFAARLPSDRIALNCGAVELDVSAKKIRLANGRTEAYETLISTIPLDQLALMSGRSDWIELASRLRHTAVHVVGVGLNGRAPSDLATKCWTYFPEPEIPFYRATHFSLYSPELVDDIAKHWSILCEVSESSGKRVDPETVVDETIQGLTARGLIEGKDQVHHTWWRRVEYGYPAPTRGRDEVLHELLVRLEQSGILSRGRFGAWRYEVANQDHSFMQGYEAAAHALFGFPEITLWEPSVVNTRHPALGWDRFR